jgi:hypothetical protein
LRALLILPFSAEEALDYFGWFEGQDRVLFLLRGLQDLSITERVMLLESHLLDPDPDDLESDAESASRRSASTLTDIDTQQ